MRQANRARAGSPFHRSEPRLHLLLVSAAALAALAVQGGVWWLRSATERRERELTEFAQLRSQMEWTGGTGLGDAPSSATPELREIARRLQEQTWYQSVPGIEPRIEKTAAGMRIALSTAAGRRDKGREAKPSGAPR